MEEVLQVQKTITRNTTFKNEQLQAFTRIEETFTGLFYNVNERYKQVVSNYTSQVGRLEERIEKLEEQNYELVKEVDNYKEIKELGKRELDRQLKDYMSSEMIISKVYSSLDLTEKVNASQAATELDQVQ